MRSRKQLCQNSSINNSVRFIFAVLIFSSKILFGSTQDVALYQCTYNESQYTFSYQEYKALQQCGVSSQEAGCQNQNNVKAAQSSNCNRQDQNSVQLSQAVFSSQQNTQSCTSGIHVKCITQQGTATVAIADFGQIAKGNAYCVAICGENGPTIAKIQQPTAYKQSYWDYVEQAGQSNVHQYSQNGYLVSCSTNYIGFYSCQQSDGSRVPINAQLLSQVQNNCVGQSITSDCFDKQTLKYTTSLASGQCTYQCMDKQQYLEQYGFTYGSATAEYINCSTGLSYQKVCQYSDQSIVLTSANTGCSSKACTPTGKGVVETSCTDQCFINVRTGQSLLSSGMGSTSGSSSSQCCKTVQQGQLAPAPIPEVELKPIEDTGPVTDIPSIQFFPNNIGPKLFAPNPEYFPYINPSNSPDAHSELTPNNQNSPKYLVNQQGGNPTSLYLPSSEISPNSFRTQPFGEPIFTNSPEMLEVPAPGFLNPLSAPLEESTTKQNRSQYLGNPNITIPSNYKALCTDIQESNYGCNLNLVEIPIEQTNSSVWIGSWEACSAACGGGVAFRSINCIDSLYKFPISPENCGSQLDYYGFDVHCNMQACTDTHWVLGNFSQCVNQSTGEAISCGGGVRRRQAQCMGSDGTQIARCQGTKDCQQVIQANPQCTSPPSELIEIECNTTPCSSDIYTYKIGSWSSCNGSCDNNNSTGNRTRTVKCVGVYNNEVDNSHCLQPAPSESSGCYLECLQPQKSGSSSFVPQKRSLLELKVDAEDLGIEGVRRNLLQQQTIYDGQGNKCLSGKVDKCGICDGNCRTFDLQGRPCDLTLDQAGSCCETGDIVQGVCKGDPQQLNISSQGVCTANKQNDRDCPILPEVKCPLGSSVNNPNETLALCSNRGRCAYLTSICDCFVGYYGESCDRCAPDFTYDTQTKACVPSNKPIEVPQKAQGPTTSQPSPFKSHFSSTRTFRGVVVAIAIGVALFLACLWILIFALILFFRRRKMQKKYNNKVKLFANMIDTKTQPRTYSGVWQSFTEKLAGPMENVTMNGSSHSQQDLLATNTTPSPQSTSPFQNRGIQQEQQQQTGLGSGMSSNNSIQNLLNGNSRNPSNQFNVSDSRK